LKNYEEKYYSKRNTINYTKHEKDLNKFENYAPHNMDPLSKEMYKLSLKESALKIIIEY